MGFDRCFHCFGVSVEYLWWNSLVFMYVGYTHLLTCLVPKQTSVRLWCLGKPENKIGEYSHQYRCWHIGAGNIWLLDELHGSFDRQSVEFGPNVNWTMRNNSVSANFLILIPNTFLMATSDRRSLQIIKHYMELERPFNRILIGIRENAHFWKGWLTFQVINIKHGTTFHQRSSCSTRPD